MCTLHIVMIFLYVFLTNITTFVGSKYYIFDGNLVLTFVLFFTLAIVMIECHSLFIVLLIVEYPIFVACHLIIWLLDFLFYVKYIRVHVVAKCVTPWKSSLSSRYELQIDLPSTTQNLRSATFLHSVVYFCSFTNVFADVDSFEPIRIHLWLSKVSGSYSFVVSVSEAVYFRVLENNFQFYCCRPFAPLLVNYNSTEAHLYRDALGSVEQFDAFRANYPIIALRLNDIHHFIAHFYSLLDNLSPERLLYGDLPHIALFWYVPRGHGQFEAVLDQLATFNRLHVKLAKFSYLLTFNCICEQYVSSRLNEILSSVDYCLVDRDSVCVMNYVQARRKLLELHKLSQSNSSLGELVSVNGWSVKFLNFHKDNSRIFSTITRNLCTIDVL